MIKSGNPKQVKYTVQRAISVALELPRVDISRRIRLPQGRMPKRSECNKLIKFYRTSPVGKQGAVTSSFIIAAVLDLKEEAMLAYYNVTDGFSTTLPGVRMSQLAPPARM